jgi:hypothetical protein
MTFPPTEDDRRAAMKAARWLRWGVAFVWLWTGLAVFHPYYRELGTAYLAPLGLPSAVMYATCAAEVLLGLRVALGRAATWLTVLQVVMISGFTVILSVSEPALWINGMGVLIENLVLVEMIVTAWLLEREGWTRRAEHLLRFGLALFWILLGTLPWAAGGHITMYCWNIGLGLLIAASAGALALSVLAAAWFIVLGTIYDPLSWFHPFGPMTKIVAIMIASAVATFRLLTRQGHAPPAPR